MLEINSLTLGDEVGVITVNVTAGLLRHKHKSLVQSQKCR